MFFSSIEINAFDRSFLRKTNDFSVGTIPLDFRQLPSYSPRQSHDRRWVPCRRNNYHDLCTRPKWLDWFRTWNKCFPQVEPTWNVETKISESVSVWIMYTTLPPKKNHHWRNPWPTAALKAAATASLASRLPARRPWPETTPKIRKWFGPLQGLGVFRV